MSFGPKILLVAVISLVVLTLPSSGIAATVTSGDFDGDGKADLAIFRPLTGQWFIIPSGNPGTPIIQQWGLYGDVAVPGDYDGDGKTDFALWRPLTGQWFIIPSSNPNTPITQSWGLPGDIPVPGDYDGDGKTDFALWRPSTGQWLIIPSSNPNTPITQSWGLPGDIPVPGDYDGDGKTDFAVWRPSTGQWFVIPSGNPNTPITQSWGVSGDIPVPRDYDGDGKADFAVWRPSTGQWFIIPSLNPGSPTVTSWGHATDAPVQEPVAEFTPTCILFGQYVFQVAGTDTNGAAAMVGSVTIAQNGFVVTGAIDFKDHSALLANQRITGGSCVNTAVVNQGQAFVGGIGKLSITAGGVNRTFNFAMRTHNDNGHIVEADTTGVNAAGGIQLQLNPTKSPQGSYALGLYGRDSGGNGYAIGGEMCLNALRGISFLQADLNDNNVLSTMSGLQSAASFSAPDSNGRSTSAITFTSGQVLNLTFYGTNSGNVGQAFAIESTPIATSTQVLAGQVAGVQGAVCYSQGLGGSYSNSTLKEVAFLSFALQPGTAKGEIGALQNINAGAGTASLTFDSNTGGTLESASGLTFTYSISSTGRGTASYTDPVSKNVVQTLMYMLPDGSHFLLILDNFVSLGFANSRGCTAPFTACIGGGNYAFGGAVLGTQAVTEVTINTSALTFSDTTAGGSSGPYSLSSTTGRGTVALNNAVTFGDTSIIFYIKGPNNIYTLTATSATPADGDLLR